MMHRRTFLKASLAASALACVHSSRTATRTKMKILILGGTGYLGPAIVDAARPRGHVLTLFNRGKTNPGMFPDLEQLRGDRDGKLDSLKGRTWDAVIDDTGFVPRVVRQSAELLKGQVGRYLYVSSISVYADEKTLGQDETAARQTLPAEAAGSEEVRKYYSPLKAGCEDVVTEVYGDRRTVVRPGYIIGPRDPYDRLTYWAARCDRGGDMLAPGDGRDPVQFIDVRDLARWMVDVVERDTAGAYNATGPAEKLTMKGFLEACQQATPTRTQLVWVPEAFLREHQISPEDDAREDLPLWLPNQALSQVSIARATAKGLVFRPASETARDTLAWWKTQPEARRAKMRGGLTVEREKEILDDWEKKRKG